MADRTEKLSIVVTAKDLAAGKLSKVRGELAQMGRGGQIAAVGLGTGIKSMRTMQGAASHLGGVLGKLAGPLGLIGLTGAVFGLEQLLTSSVGKATAFGEAVDKVRAITGASAQATSALVDTLDYYGIKAEDQTRIVGMAEKNLGMLTTTQTKAGASTEQLTKARERLHLAQVKLHEVESKDKSTGSQRMAARQRVADAERALAAVQAKRGVTVSNAQKFEKQYGLSLLDSKGKVRDFNSMLIVSADYFNNKSIPAQTKAAALAKIYGRNWQELIPILTQGSAKIRAAEGDAIQLTGEDLANMTKFKEASRQWDDTLGDLQVTIGAKLLPSLTDLAKTGSAFLKGHSGDIIRFFQNGLKSAQRFAGFVTGSVVPAIGGLAGSAKGFWDSMPGPLRDIIVKGFVADRAIHFLFGLSPGKLALSLAGDVLGPVISKGLGGIFGGFAQRGSSPANPVFVSGTGLPGAGPDGIPPAGTKSGVKTAVKEGFDLLKMLALPVGAGIAAGTIAANNQAAIFGQPGADPKAVNDAVKSGAMTFNGRVFQVAVKPVEKELAQLRGDTRDLTTHVQRGAMDTVAANRAQAIQVAGAIRDKDLSVAIKNAIDIRATVNVSSRAIGHTLVTDAIRSNFSGTADPRAGQ